MSDTPVPGPDPAAAPDPGAGAGVEAGPGAAREADQAPPRAEEPGRGVRIGVDVGSVRVGVAASDPDGLLAVPVTTLRRDASGRRHKDVDELADIVRDRHAVEVVVGLPRQLSGEEGEAVRRARQYAEVLSTRVAPVPVRLVDERLTTVVAHRRMAERGLRSRARRELVDQEAAVQILQHHLDIRRAREAASRAAPDGAARPQDSV
ncbi:MULTISPECIES: Holliday junction resolvase RuvX [Parafrankia]|uniref:Holliday junction resolvase RuvX n=1 Tax=Parafrankia TaxID=2994362 RepID=UPI000B1BD6D9